MTAPAQPVALAAEAGTDGILLWVALPYVSLAVFVLGHVWRYRYDKFGWTTRSSQLYERRLLRIGSPLFHFGILVCSSAISAACSSPRAGPKPSGSASTRTTSARSFSAPSRASPRSAGWRS